MTSTPEPLWTPAVAGVTIEGVGPRLPSQLAQRIILAASHGSTRWIDTTKGFPNGPHSQRISDDAPDLRAGVHGRPGAQDARPGDRRQRVGLRPESVGADVGVGLAVSDYSRRVRRTRPGLGRSGSRLGGHGILCVSQPAAVVGGAVRPGGARRGIGGAEASHAARHSDRAADIRARLYRAGVLMVAGVGEAPGRRKRRRLHPERRKAVYPRRQRRRSHPGGRADVQRGRARGRTQPDGRQPEGSRGFGPRNGRLDWPQGVRGQLRQRRGWRVGRSWRTRECVEERSSLRWTVRPPSCARSWPEGRRRCTT